MEGITPKQNDETRSACPAECGADATKFITEGLVKIRAPEGESVFFNPAQVFNRDLSLLVLKAYATRQKRIIASRSEAAASRRLSEGREAPPPLQFGGLNVLEPLAATGLRSLRYLKELPETVHSAVANDIDAEAVRQIQKNAELNEISHEKLHSVCADACRLMRLLSDPPLRRSTLKKLHSCPAGSLPPSSFDMSFPAEDASLVAPIFGKEGRGGVPLWYDVVDVDPYGSCASFLDAAISALRSGGLLCLTSTDMCTLVGNCQETCFYKYGGSIAKTNFHHEAAIRLVLHAVAQAAARQQKTVEPLLCLSVDFYVRLFVVVKDSAESCKFLHQREALTFHCPACEAFAVAPLGVMTPKKARKAKKGSGGPEKPQDKAGSVAVSEIQNDDSSQPEVSSSADAVEGGRLSARFKFRAGNVPVGVSEKCSECYEAVQLIGGPFYSGPYYDSDFVDLCLEELKTADETLPGLTMQKRIAGMLIALKEELPDVPMFYLLPSLCARQKLPMVKPGAFKSALRRLGFRVSHFHRDPQAVKTDAPATVVFDIIRTHAKTHAPANIEKYPVLTKEIVTQNIDLSIHHPNQPASNESKKQTAVPRWLPNPLPHWGPKGRAGKRRKTEGPHGNSEFDPLKLDEAPSSSLEASAESNPLVKE